MERRNHLSKNFALFVKIITNQVIGQIMSEEKKTSEKEDQASNGKENEEASGWEWNSFGPPTGKGNWVAPPYKVPKGTNMKGSFISVQGGKTTVEKFSDGRERKTVTERKFVMVVGDRVPVGLERTARSLHQTDDDDDEQEDASVDQEMEDVDRSPKMDPR